MFGSKIERKTDEQFRLMRRAGLVVAQTLSLVHERAAPGMTTRDLDGIAEESIRSHGATSNFKGYHGFPGVICTSVNEEIVHGIPGDRVLADGDVVSVDCGAIVEGWHGDAAVTFTLGEAPEDVRSLLTTCERSLWQGILGAWKGTHIGDIGYAVDTYVNDHGNYGMVDGFTGHGIGTAMHMEPSVPNQGRPGRGVRIRPGMALAIEPMITMHPTPALTLDDDWTVVAVDGSLAAHFEHSIAITSEGVSVLTAHDGGRSELEGLGVPFVSFD